jgi:hypothetical protein
VIRQAPSPAAAAHPKVELLEALHNGEEGTVVRVELSLTRTVEQEVMSPQPAQRSLEPVQVLLQILEAKDQG